MTETPYRKIAATVAEAVADKTLKKLTVDGFVKSHD